MQNGEIGESFPMDSETANDSPFDEGNPVYPPRKPFETRTDSRLDYSCISISELGQDFKGMLGK